MALKAFKQKLLAQIEDSQRIAIATHMGPDHDAIGSSLGISKILQKLYPEKKFQVLIEGLDFSKDFWMMPGIEEIEWIQDLPKTLQNDYDMVVVIDCNKNHMLSRHNTEVSGLDMPTFAIDHHDTKSGFDNTYVGTNVMSSAQMIYSLFKDVELDSDTAKLLFAGHYSDSIGFSLIRKNNLDSFVMVIELMKHIDQEIEQIATEINSISEDMFGVFKSLVENTNNIDLKNGEKITYSFLSSNDLKDKNARGVSKRLYYHVIIGKIIDRRWGFAVQEKREEFYISFRSNIGSVNVREICERYFDGGGHDLAAGGRIVKSDKIKTVEQAIEYVLNILEKTEFSYVSNS